MGKLHILLVDDSLSYLAVLKQLLESIDAEIVCAVDGKKAIAIIKKMIINLVITDAVMPVMDGYELTRFLKDSKKTLHIPVIMISDYYSDDNIEKGFLSGASAFISKEELQENFLPLVKSYLDKSLNFHKRTILIVDDSSSICTLLKEELSMAGFGYMTAGDGSEALEILESVIPDLIVSDIEMPGMDGYKFRKSLLNNPKLSNIPFIAMSGRGHRSDVSRFSNLKAAAFMVKPFNTEELVIIIERVLSDQFQMLMKEQSYLTKEHDILLDTITSLARVLDARDPYTQGHSDSVAQITGMMVEAFGGSGIDIEMAMRGAKLHDIGKIGTPDSILLKPGKLTKSEFSIIKEHPLVGAEILEPIESLESIISIVKYHHERFDGSGYPDGLVGTEIPFLARITSVADVFDALISDRPYRKKMERAVAYKIIRDQRGTKLCPVSVDLFFKAIEL